MTNEEIIMDARLALMSEGRIKGTGRYMELTDENGEEIRLEEPEEIHTFAAWKERGFTVRRGEHAVVKLRIWKHTVKRAEDPEKENDLERMFMKTAFFFSPDQVEPLKEEKK